MYSAFMLAPTRVTIEDFVHLGVCVSLEQDPALATCVNTQRVAKANTGRGGTAVSYPPCAYTRTQLQRMVAYFGVQLKEFGYELPPQCAPVLAGFALGGTDAQPVPLAPDSFVGVYSERLPPPPPGFVV